MDAARARHIADHSTRLPDTLAAYKERMPIATAALLQCSEEIERLTLELEDERRRRREAEAETRAVKGGALDHMELDGGGLQGGALLEAVRLVRFHLIRAGADPIMPTVGMAVWASERLAALAQPGRPC